MHPTGYSTTQRWLYDLLHRIAVSRARRVITLSNAARADLVQRFRIPSHQIAVIPPGHLPPSRRDAPTPPQPYLLYVGINKPHKNLPRLVEACARLGPDAPALLLAGPHDSRFPQTRQTIERLGLTGRARWLGRVSDEELAALYANAALVTIPSLAEGFGFPVLEAMALGAPVACSDISALRELAEDAALYFDPLNVEAIAATIRRALTDSELRQAMRRRGLARAADFTWARAAAATRRVYEECAS
jgi:alpha-1,3-rhamnosyl/mannosyltransferase